MVKIIKRQKTEKSVKVKLNPINIGTSSNQRGVMLIKRTFKMFVLCAVVSTILLLNNSDIFAMTDSSACGYSEFLDCYGEYIFYHDENGNSRTSFKCDLNEDMYDKEGHQRGAVGTKGGIAFSNTTDEITGYTATMDCIAYPTDDNDVPVGDTITISAGSRVILDFNTNSTFSWVIFEWTDGSIYKFNSDKYREIPKFPVINCYTGTKALIVPNPVSNTTTITLAAEYIDFCNVTSVRYEIYNSEQKLLTTLSPNNPTDIAQISATYINTNGTYFVKCCVSKENESEIFDLSFVVNK